MFNTSRFIRRAALIAMAVSAVSAGHANAQTKANIILDVTSDDTVGRQFIFRLRERITASSTLKIGRKGESGLGVKIVTMDTDTSSPGSSTIYSMVFVIPSDSLPSYLTNYVGICGVSNVQSCAESAFSTIGEQLEQIRSALAN